MTREGLLDFTRGVVDAFGIDRQAFRAVALEWAPRLDTDMGRYQAIAGLTATAALALLVALLWLAFVAWLVRWTRDTAIPWVRARL